MIIDKTYKVLIISTNEIHSFATSLTEREFYNSLDGVYGTNGYKVLEIA